MNCLFCGKEMIWGADFDFEDYGIEGEGIVAEYSCICGCSATFYTPATAEMQDNIKGGGL